MSSANAVRLWAVKLARSFKWTFAHAFVPRAWIFRWLFVGENGELSVVGQHVLADLRDFCGASAATVFNKDPIEMARREGRREVFVRIQNFLNLDEAKVQKLMEIDDGFGE